MKTIALILIVLVSCSKETVQQPEEEFVLQGCYTVVITEIDSFMWNGEVCFKGDSINSTYWFQQNGNTLTVDNGQVWKDYQITSTDPLTLDYAGQCVIFH